LDTTELYVSFFWVSTFFLSSTFEAAKVWIHFFPAPPFADITAERLGGEPPAEGEGVLLIPSFAPGGGGGGTLTENWCADADRKRALSN